MFNMRMELLHEEVHADYVDPMHVFTPEKSNGKKLKTGTESKLLINQSFKESPINDSLTKLIRASDEMQVIDQSPSKQREESLHTPIRDNNWISRIGSPDPYRKTQQLTSTLTKQHQTNTAK